MSELDVHPVAALFPMLADDELDELAADIKARGLLQPIVLDAEGRVLDGRNRLAACKKVGVEPTFVTYADGDPDGHALAVNINRRHLKPSVRHLINEMARRLAHGPKMDQDLNSFAKESGVGKQRRIEAAVVLDYAPDLCREGFRWWHDAATGGGNCSPAQARSPGFLFLNFCFNAKFNGGKGTRIAIGSGG
jgi:hypothetical protein